VGSYRHAGAATATTTSGPAASAAAAAALLGPLLHPTRFRMRSCGMRPLARLRCCHEVPRLRLLGRAPVQEQHPPATVRVHVQVALSVQRLQRLGTAALVCLR
jgi:hypothetical protein